jgi:hypothetical protein
MLLNYEGEANRTLRKESKKALPTLLVAFGVTVNCIFDVSG